MNISESNLRKLMAQTLAIQPGDVGDDASMDTIEGWDSLKQLQIVLALEEAYGVSFGEDEALDITSLDLIREALKRHNVNVAS